MNNVSVKKFTRGNLAMVLTSGLALICIILAIGPVPAQSAVHHKRSTTNPTSENPATQAQRNETCYSDGICGWEVYQRYTRETLYYVPATCKCPCELACVRAEDDVLAFYWIYRCRVYRRNRHRGSSSENPTMTSSSGTSSETNHL